MSGTGVSISISLYPLVRLRMFITIPRGKTFPSRVCREGCREFKVSCQPKILINLAPFSESSAKTESFWELRKLSSTRWCSQALINASTLLTFTLEELLTELSQMEDQSSKEPERRLTNTKACSALDAQDLFSPIELPWSSRWAPSTLHTDHSVPLSSSPIMMPWRVSNSTWSSHLVLASNITDAPPEEANKLPEMK